MIFNTFCRYCEIIQDIIGIPMFIQFGVGSLMICVVLCEFLLVRLLVLIFFTIKNETLSKNTPVDVTISTNVQLAQKTTKPGHPK